MQHPVMKLQNSIHFFVTKQAVGSGCLFALGLPPLEVIDVAGGDKVPRKGGPGGNMFGKYMLEQLFKKILFLKLSRVKIILLGILR